MKEAEILERFEKTLDFEISNKKDPFRFQFFLANYAKGNITDEDIIEVRGYYKGLKVAKEMLQIIKSEYEEVEQEGESNG